MSILKEYTKILSEKLPLSLARQYTKQGRENVLKLPPEINVMYKNIFGDKQRVVIGEVTIPIDEKELKVIRNDFLDIKRFIHEYQFADEEGTGLLYDFSLKDFDPSDPNYVEVQTRDTFDPKEISQAYDKKKGKYLFKTLIKRLKKYFTPEKFNELQQQVGKFLTKTSNWTKTSTAPVVLSRHPYDVGGMSTSQGWESCKDAIKGCNRRFLKNEVGQLSVAYVVNPNRKGKDLLSSPYSRLLVIPVEGSEGYGLYVSSNIYGANIPDFYSVVYNYIDSHAVAYDNSEPLTMVDDYYVDYDFPKDEDSVELHELFNNIDEYLTKVPDNIIQDIKISTQVQYTDYGHIQYFDNSTLRNFNDLFLLFDKYGIDYNKFSQFDYFEILNSMQDNNIDETEVMSRLAVLDADKMDIFALSQDNKLSDSMDDIINSIIDENPPVFHDDEFLSDLIKHVNDNPKVAWDELDWDELQDTTFDDVVASGGVTGEELIKFLNLIKFGDAQNWDDEDIPEYYQEMSGLDDEEFKAVNDLYSNYNPVIQALTVKDFTNALVSGMDDIEIYETSIKKNLLNLDDESTINDFTNAFNAILTSPTYSTQLKLNISKKTRDNMAQYTDGKYGYDVPMAVLLRNRMKQLPYMDSDVPISLKRPIAPNVDKLYNSMIDIADNSEEELRDKWEKSHGKIEDSYKNKSYMKYLKEKLE